MNIFFPDNIFTRSLYFNLNEEKQSKVTFTASSVLSKKLNDEPNSIALIPALELITNQELFISRSVGLSFDGSLCNSYIYFNSEQERIHQVRISGDVSSMEVIMCKILFKELYNTEVEITISKKTENLESGTHIVAGDDNFNNSKFRDGISFAEEVVELISAPYVNYVFASNDKELLKDYSKSIMPKLSNFNLSESEEINRFNESSAAFIKENSKSIICNLDEQDIVGINELIRLPYYYGLIKDLFEVKFV
jgi:hypothetical protein